MVRKTYYLAQNPILWYVFCTQSRYFSDETNLQSLLSDTVSDSKLLDSIIARVKLIQAATSGNDL